jgi:hypothetical protein
MYVLVGSKLVLLYIARRQGMDAFALARDFVAVPLVVAVNLAALAWVCWVTWRLGRADSDTRFLLQLLIAFDVILFPIVVFLDKLAW